MLFLDTSALVKRYVDEPGTDLVVRRMDEDREWAASVMARTETEITLCMLGFTADEQPDVWQRLREDWDRCHVIPVDAACLDRAAEIGCDHGARTLDAVHLAAADRMPRPLVLLTFDRRQADAARSMDLPVEGA
ncbi:MAG: type II toxin-antitoxin system VapC family toxin [Chloroflexi bacterium]|nr:type II toxin-antitoxin system VapC family toxin [Chloroflexota bacterium]